METIKYSNNGQPYTGIYENRYPDGTLRERLPYKDGYPDGVHEVWNPDGTLRQRVNYQGGFREGECLLLYPSRHIYSVYHRGELQLYKEYALALKQLSQE